MVNRFPNKFVALNNLWLQLASKQCRIPEEQLYETGSGWGTMEFELLSACAVSCGASAGDRAVRRRRAKVTKAGGDVPRERALGQRLCHGDRRTRRPGRGSYQGRLQRVRSWLFAEHPRVRSGVGTAAEHGPSRRYQSQHATRFQ